MARSSRRSVVIAAVVAAAALVAGIVIGVSVSSRRTEPSTASGDPVATTTTPRTIVISRGGATTDATATGTSGPDVGSPQGPGGAAPRPGGSSNDDGSGGGPSGGGGLGSAADSGASSPPAGEAPTGAGAGESAAGPQPSTGGPTSTAVAPTTTTPQPDAPVTISPASASGLTNGQALSLHIAARPGHLFYSATARMCSATAVVLFQTQFQPLRGNCADGPVSPQADSYVLVPTKSPNQAADLTFKVGTGTATWPKSGGGSASLTCDAAHPCQLVLQIEIPDGTYFESVPLGFT